MACQQVPVQPGDLGLADGLAVPVLEDAPVACGVDDLICGIQHDGGKVGKQNHAHIPLISGKEAAKRERNEEKEQSLLPGMAQEHGEAT